MIRVAIVGASGYTGAEAIDILLKHPQAKLTYATGQTETGPIADIFGQFRGRCDIVLEHLDIEKLKKLADVALCCLPHKVSMDVIPSILSTGVKVVDLSADYRIKDPAVYEAAYKHKHMDLANLSTAVYGLCELYRNQIKTAKLVANPGCFPTGAALAMAPLLKNKLVDPTDIIVNSVSGVTGAGKAPNANFHFPNMNDNLFAYGIGTHRHNPEIEQTASDLTGAKATVLFQPHVGCFDRGILSSVYMKPTASISSEDVLKLFQDFYKNERFVQVIKTAPMLKHVAHTNYCQVFPAVVKGRVVIFSAIDNMVKGASGQAIQNMNIMFGIDESAGLI